MDERLTVSKSSGDMNNTEIVVLNQSSPGSATLQNISPAETWNNNLLYHVHEEEKESCQPCSSQENDERLFQLSNQSCCTAKEFVAGFSGKVFVDPGGLYVPWELYQYMEYDLLRPLAKLQTLGSINLYDSIRIELRRRGKNGGLRMLNIARELAVPGYFRELRALWDNYSDTKENDFEFAFVRIISFLYWADANIYLLTDLGPLDVEKLMLCYNCRWGETSTARKHFDRFMRQILFDMKDLLAVRSWCGILREKTIVDVAMIRAEYLIVLDLGTMVSKGPLKKWNLKELFIKLKNLEDFTWLNCDVRTLIYLASVDSLKRLVLHVTKYDQVFFEQFFGRFGYNVDMNSRKSRDNEKHVPLVLQSPIYNDHNYYSLSYTCDSEYETQEMPSSSTLLKQEIGNQTWVSVEAPTKKIHLEYAALSFAFATLQCEEHCLQKEFSPVLESKGFHVPLAVITADTVILNLPPCLYQSHLIDLGIPKKKFGIGLPKEICANIKPNRISYESIVQVLEDNACNRIGQETNVEEAEIHVMLDYYRKERVVHLFNLAMLTFFPKILRLHFIAAGPSMKKYYKYKPRSISNNNALFLRYLKVFELTLNCLTFQIPNVISYSLMPNLEEVYITLCGLPHNECRTIENVVEFFQFFMQPKEHLRTVIFRVNAPFFFNFFETLTTAEIPRNGLPFRLEILGIVCCVPETETPNLLSSRIHKAIENMDPNLRRQLKKLILDGRVWGALSSEHLADVHDLLLNCTFEAELAPDDCKDLKYRRIYESGVVRNLNSSDSSESEDSESPALDDGDEYFMRSDYSDSADEKNESRTFAEILTSVVNKKNISRGKNRYINPSQSSSKEEIRNNITGSSSWKKGKFRFRRQKNAKKPTASSDEEWHPGIKSKKRKFLLRKQNNFNETAISSDDEWHPGISLKKRKLLLRSYNSVSESASSDDEWRPRISWKKRKFPLRKQNNVSESASSDDEWRPGTSLKKRK